MFYINPYFITSIPQMSFIEILQAVGLIVFSFTVAFMITMYEEYKNPCFEDENGNMVLPSKQQKS